MLASTTRLIGLLALFVASALSGPAQAASIVSVSSGPQDGAATPHIEVISNPICCEFADYALHDHVYVGPYIPDPSRAYVIFEFDAPVVVSGLTMIQHQNGITAVEQFVGDALSSLSSAGTAYSSYGDVTGSSVFPEFAPDVFTDFSGTRSCIFHKFIIAKTSFDEGYATYRWYLNVVPEPSTWALMMLGLGVMLAGRALRRMA